MAVRGIGKGLQVDDIAGRVADRLAEHCLGAAVDQRFEGGDVVMGGEAGLDAEARQGMGQQVVGTAVELGHRDDIVAGFGHGLDRVGDRRHARGHGQGTDTAFERRHALLEYVVGRVHDPAIDVAGDFQVEQIGAVLGVVEGKRGGLVDRYRDGLGGRVGAEARVDGQGFQLHAIFLESRGRG
ncbi:hypothetical protein D3C81_873270 [compost metagenome]